MPIGGLLLLSLLWAAGWVRADLFPGSGKWVRLGPLESEAAVLGAFAGLAAVVWWVRMGRAERGLKPNIYSDGFVARLKPCRYYKACNDRLPKQASSSCPDAQSFQSDSRGSAGGRLAGRAALVGMGLFVAPAVLGGLARGWVEDSARVVLFSLIPLFAVVLEPHFGAGGGSFDGARGGMAAAMLGVAGTLLVFPVELPRSYGAAFAIAGLLVAAIAIAGANCLGVGIAREGGSVAALSAIAAGSAAVLLGLLGLVVRQNEASGVALDFWSIPDLVAMGLLFWLMRRMSAASMTTRFWIAPLLANLISLVFLRPHVEAQAWIGLLMIAAGSGWMLWARGDNDDSAVVGLGVK